MVTNRKKDSDKTPVKQGPDKVSSEPNKINASTPYDFNGKKWGIYFTQVTTMGCGRYVVAP